MDWAENLLSIEDLPEEVLEYILSLVSPYKDLHECMRVSKKWRRCVLNVIKLKQRNFYRAINEFDVKWDRVSIDDGTPSITKRYSHSAIVCDDYMYIFGGCTSSNTTFNDLWRLDLSTRTWVRPITMGSYPSPKASSSLIKYKDMLVLFGGWTYPPAYPLYQSRLLFNELHIYNITSNRWHSLCIVDSPPPMAGHSATLVGEWMIIFGGLQKPSTAVHSEKSNDIWKLNLETWTWYKQPVYGGPKPAARFGQTQVILDDKNLLILGGTGGPNNQFSDCWLLNMEGVVWKWTQIIIEGKENAPGNISSNPGCKIGDKIVILNRIKHQDDSGIVYYPRSEWNQQPTKDPRLSRIDVASRKADLDVNVNGRRGELRLVKTDAAKVPADKCLGRPLPSNYMATGWAREQESNDIFGFAQKVEEDNRKEQRIFTLEEQCLKKGLNFGNRRGPYLGLYVLDIGQVLKAQQASWLTPKNVQGGPEETILYSLVPGRSELIMFGGILKDSRSLAQCSLYSQISNLLYFITAPNYVI